jgi:N-hydroxyarylamine O-acetyltransferase
MNKPDKLFGKYLELLGIEKSRPADFDLLRNIVKAHLIKVPFENISKLIYKKRGMNYIPNLELFLEGIEKYNLGGTCYSNNYYLYLLLKHLGYKIKLCGADMKNPDVHLISLVIIDDKEYIIDGGYAAPFFEPLPIDSEDDFIIQLANEKYIVKRKDESGRTTVEQYSQEKLQHWYTANPQPRKIEEFKKVIEESYSDSATFMNAVRITRFSDAGSLVLKNLSLTETLNGQSVTTTIHFKDIPSLIDKKFRIPVEIVLKAIGDFKELKDIYD